MRIKLSDTDSESQPISEEGKNKPDKGDYLCRLNPTNLSPSQSEED